jgi:UDP-glucose 4-epimerase
MAVLVTGGAGYIGSVCVEHLLGSGEEVVVFDNLSRGHREAVPDGARFFEGDLLSPEDLEGVFASARFDCVMHFAAHSQVPESMSDPGKYFGDNVGGGVAILEGMRRHNVPAFLFSSTAAVYGTPHSIPIREDDPTVPTNPYGESKLMLETVLSWYARLHSIRSVRLRYFNAAGATADRGEDHDPETHLIPVVLEAAAGKRAAVEIYGEDYGTKDGTCVRDYIHVSDLAEAHRLALLKLRAGGSGVFNLGNGAGFSVREVIETARRVTGRDIPVRVGPRRPGDPPALVASSERASAELGWTAKRADLAEIIESSWRWSRAHPEGYGKRRRT